jgi:serine/threonine protein kinase
VQEELNTIIGMGGEGRNLIQFKLIWHPHPAQTIEKLKNREGIPRSYEENPRLARTVDDAETVLPSRRETRTHTPGHLQLKMRYMRVGGALGSGTYGTVYKAIDVDSGKFMAVKILERPAKASKQEDWRISLYYALKREVETLSEISHVSKSSLASCTHETNIIASHTLLIILHHKAGTKQRWRYLWV